MELKLQLEKYLEIIRDSAEYEKSLHKEIDFYKEEVESKDLIIKNMQGTLNGYAQKLDRERRECARAKKEIEEVRRELEETERDLANMKNKNQVLGAVLEGFSEDVEKTVKNLFCEFSGELSGGGAAGRLEKERGEK